jgi:hypothetical protein
VYICALRVADVIGFALAVDGSLRAAWPRHTAFPPHLGLGVCVQGVLMLQFRVTNSVLYIQIHEKNSVHSVLIVHHIRYLRFSAAHAGATIGTASTKRSMSCSGMRLISIVLQYRLITNAMS